jgi:hypothetical protein
VKPVSVDLSPTVAIQSGSDYVWCQGSGSGSVAAGYSGTLSVDLADLATCFGGTMDLSAVQAVWIYLNPGDYLLDDVRVDTGQGGGPTTTTSAPTTTQSTGGSTVLLSFQNGTQNVGVHGDGQARRLPVRAELRRLLGRSLRGRAHPRRRQ